MSSCCVANFVPNRDYYIWLESSECQLSNPLGITSIGHLQLKLCSFEEDKVAGFGVQRLRRRLPQTWSKTPDSGGSNALSTPYYYILLESPECLLSNAVGSASFGAPQLELYSVEGAEVSWPHCRLPPCSFMHIAGQFSPSILVSTMQCHICLESS